MAITTDRDLKSPSRQIAMSSSLFVRSGVQTRRQARHQVARRLVRHIVEEWRRSGLPEVARPPRTRQWIAAAAAVCYRPRSSPAWAKIDEAVIDCGACDPLR
jgi:hypothetical protein